MAFTIAITRSNVCLIGEIGIILYILEEQDLILSMAGNFWIGSLELIFNAN